MPWSVQDIPDQTGRVAVVTGANGGLGLASATALAGAGAHVVMAARNQAKATAARDRILVEHPEASLEIVELDLGSLRSVAQAADAIAAGHDRVDVLMCNAGVMAMPQGTTEDGFDTQLGINHLGHWALVSQLLPIVVRTAGARVVTVSSTAQHQGRPLDPDDPHMRRDYDPWQMYGTTKLANRHFAVGLNLRFERAGVDAKGMTSQPGLTDSGLQQRTVDAGSAGIAGTVSLAVTRAIGMGVEQGALSQLRAATDPDAPGGSYFAPVLGITGPPVRRPLVRPGEADAIRTLWAVSERETGLRVDVDEALAAR